MRIYLQITAVVFVILFTNTNAENTSNRVSVAPKNNLSSIVNSGARGDEIFVSICGRLSKEFKEGFRIGTKNGHLGTRNILMIDDGKSTFPAADKETGFPIIVLTDAKITKEFLDMVRGYNASMKEAFRQRNENTEHAAPRNR